MVKFAETRKPPSIRMIFLVWYRVSRKYHPAIINIKVINMENEILKIKENIVVLYVIVFCISIILTIMYLYLASRKQ